MSRALFGQWGIHLANEAFARAVAAVGVLGLGHERLEADAIQRLVQRLRRQGGDIAPLSRNHLAGLVRQIADGNGDIPEAPDYLAAWATFDECWSASSDGHGPFLRLEISTPGLNATRPDTYWLLRLLLDNDIGHSVYLRHDRPNRPIAWEWPLRLGILPGTDATALAEDVAAIPWPDLIRLTEIANDNTECDLLLLPNDLRGGLARVLQQPRRLRADCVLLLGGAGVTAERIRPMVASLRSEVVTGGVCICSIEPDARHGWLIRLIEELSHDLSLDIALNRATKYQGCEQAGPLILESSRRLVAVSRISTFARRLSQDVRRMAAARPELEQELMVAASDLEASVGGGSFLAESGDARDIASIRRGIEAHLGGTMSPMPAGAATPPPDRPDERRVSFTIDEIRPGKPPLRVEDRLASERAYLMQLFIGLPRAGVESAAERFPSDKLPASRDGHWLDVFFVPLVRAGSGRFHSPQQGRIFLPPSGDSTTCFLNFRTHGVHDNYRARILISHENRVIQTLLLSSGIGAQGEGLALAVENVVSPSFNPTGESKPFDAAIVVNHSPAGQAGVTTLVGSEVSFREPVGIEKLVEPVRELLSTEASFPEMHSALDAPELLQLFDKLAQYGRSILKPMPPELQGSIPEGARIQIVEARAGAWLPVEIFYGSRPPRPGKPLCPNARAALLQENGASHESCPHRDDPEHQCPLRFWGFRNIIERQPCLNAPNGADYTISAPQPGANRIDALRSALIGASEKVRAKDISEPGGLIEAVGQFVQATRAVKDWNEWEQAVQQDSPSLLVLLPHSMEDPDNVGIPGLEIGGALLTPAYMESSYVAGPTTPSPVVLLLGCSTQLTDVPFLNFVEAFKREKAALVIGTLSTIRGRRTVAFVSALLEGLKSAAGSNRSFGEVFLETKRKLLAGGDGFVLSLTAYGDVGWRL
nr:hypothetical protein [Dechloromonas sp.]